MSQLIKHSEENNTTDTSTVIENHQIQEDN